MDKVEPIDFKICKFLRAKNPYGGNEGGENPWYLIDDANTICWCIKSTGGAGPDNGLVTPTSCTAGRSCFKEAEEQL